MMINLLVSLLFTTLAFSQDSCLDQFQSRHNGLSQAQQALECYKSGFSTQTSREQKARTLSQMSYLKFFIAEYYLNEKADTLLEGINLAEKAMLLFGEKYSLETYATLPASEKKVLAEALYHYGLTTARYIDIKGQWEAIKRMEDIKKSMNTIVRMKEESTAFYGAHRTLGIFHIKVPYIAGGRIELAKNFLTAAVQKTIFSKDLSLYPANNVAYAELMFKTGDDKQGCYHASIVASLTSEEVKKLENGLYVETIQSVKDAKNLMNANKCSTLF